MPKRSVINLPMVVVLALVLAVAGLSSYWYWIRWHAAHGQPPWISLGLPSAPYTVLFMGCDLNYSWDGRRQVADQKSFQSRSDTMVLVRVDPTLRQVTGLHIPRDTIADIPGFGRQKINAANALGGPSLARQTVADLLGVPIDHYVLLNLHGLVDAVNELGGVTVEVPKPMSYMDWTAKLKIDLQPGVHTLTGNQAMGFVRFCHDRDGDIGRIQRQQTFIRAFAEKMANPASWSHIPRLVAILHDSVDTDLSDVDLLQTLNLVRGMPHQQLSLDVLPGRFGAYGSWIPDRAGIDLVVAHMYGLQTVSEHAPPTPATSVPVNATPPDGTQSAAAGTRAY